MGCKHSLLWRSNNSDRILNLSCCCCCCWDLRSEREALKIWLVLRQRQRQRHTRVQKSWNCWLCWTRALCDKSGAEPSRSLAVAEGDHRSLAITKRLHIREIERRREKAECRWMSRCSAAEGIESAVVVIWKWRRPLSARAHKRNASASVRLWVTE